ncbi:MAG: PPC domain-containing protein [Burkholderiales bacterium]|nr:PPC domain-containing protein [Burkholderiales bacterium]
MPTTANISNDEVFAYAEANYRSIFTGAAISGTYQQYAYRYYAASGNYLGIDTSGGIAMLGPFTNNVLTEVGPVAAFATAISTWESSMGMGTISASGEVDSVPCTMVAGHHYRIQVQSTSGSLLDPEIARVLDPSQNTLANVSNADYGISQNAQVTFAPAVSGAYNVCVQGQYSTTGGYIVLVTDLDAATNSDTQTTIAAGQTYSDTVGSSFGTKTVFFSLTGGQEYQFTLQTATSGDALNTPVLRGVYDGAGKQLSGSFGQASGGALTVGITPSSTGTYYAVIADSYNDTGGFSFAFNAVAVAKSGPTYAVAEPITRTADDYAATSATSGRLIAGSSVSGNIETADDYDWFAIPLTAGSTYTFDLEGSATAQGTLADPLLGLHNSSGTVVARDDDNGTGLNARITYTPTSSDTYYLDATAASTTATGTYRLWATSSTATTTNDIAGSTATTETVSVGDYINGTIDNTADVDWYGVSLTAGNAYTIRLQGSSSNNGTLGDPLISGIYNSSGTVISNSYADDQDGSDSRLTFTPSTSDTYFIAAEGYGSSTGTFRLTVEGQNSTEISASITTTGIVIVNSSVTGTIDTGGDQDWFAVRLYANTRYQVDLQGLPTSSGTLSDPCLRGIYNSTGTLVSGTTDDDSGTGANALVSFTPTSAGTYYISAGAYSGTTGTYTLAVTSQGGADTPADSTTTATVSPGGSVDGLVDQTGDSDWFAVSLTAGLTYTIDLQPKSNSTSPLNDPYLYGLYNSAGNLISGTTDDDSGAGTGAQVTCAISTSGIYYISAGGYSNNVGNYALSVSSGTSGNSGGSSGGTTTTDLAATTATTGTAIVGASASSSINSANDQDWFSVNLLAGHSYGISLSGADSNGGTLTDPFLRGIYDSSGTPIPGTTDDDSGYGNDALVNFTPTSTGTYFISAGAFSSATGSYALTVSENTIAAPTPTPTPHYSGNPRQLDRHGLCRRRQRPRTLRAFRRK